MTNRVEKTTNAALLANHASELANTPEETVGVLLPCVKPADMRDDPEAIRNAIEQGKTALAAIRASSWEGTIIQDQDENTTLECVARAIWSVWVNSEIVAEACLGLSWDELTHMAESERDPNPERTIRNVTLSEARAAIRVLLERQDNQEDDDGLED